jgi:hypothetical protein
MDSDQRKVNGVQSGRYFTYKESDESNKVKVMRLVCGFSSIEGFMSWTKEIINNITNDPSERYVVGISGGSACILEMPGLNLWLGHQPY